MHKATLRLFNAVQVERHDTKDISLALERTIQNGYILAPGIQPGDDLLDVIESVVGLGGEKANATFHKSWAVVRDAFMESLVAEQIIHYLTTYGFEALGLYRQESVYIPREVLELPALQDDVPLIVIQAVDAQDLLPRIVRLGASSIALAEETLDDIMTIVQANAYDSVFVQEIKNRELKARLYDWYGIVPSEPVEFLRHLISKLTDESLLIKNDALITKIKAANPKFVDMLLQDAPDDLASIFFRYKPLFLALKSISRNKTFFNRLRKQADMLHKPLSTDYLNSVTAQIRHDILDLSVLTQRLKTASIWRKIRLVYALNYRLHPGPSIVYRVRNGRGWATGFDWPDDLHEVTQQALDQVLEAIVRDMRRGVEGKTIYIPAHVHYALPATEKQFTGHFPNGSAISVPEDMIVGIHWTNTDRRVDLDLSVIGESGKIGWDAAYRSQDRGILFSGDVTDAPPPNGASELFYLGLGVDARIMLVNYFNFSSDAPVDAQIVVAHEKPKKFGQNYVLDVNNILATARITISKKQNIVGYVTSIDGANRFYFANVSVSNSITSSRNEHSAQARHYLMNNLAHPLDFRALLVAAGATVVDEQPDGAYLDLRPDALTKATFIEQLQTGPK